MLIRCTSLVLIVGAAPVLADPDEWSSVPIVDVAPLETKLGTFSDIPGPDVLGIVLSHNGTVNVLHALGIPPPYDGSGVTTGEIDSGATLFAVGDICRQGSHIVVPYIKDFNVNVGFFDGLDWSVVTIPGSIGDSYTTTDCGVTADGFFITGQNFNDSELSVYRSADFSANFDHYGSFGGPNLVGPFSGAVRDQLVTRGIGSSRALSLGQRDNGDVVAFEFDTDTPTPGSFSPRLIITLPAPPGSFTVVRESAGARGPLAAWYTINADDNMRVFQIPFDNPANADAWNLGAINNNGTQFGFQGVAIAPLNADHVHTAGSNYYELDGVGGAVMDPDYPNVDVGGPVDGCQFNDDFGVTQGIRYLISRVGGIGTDLVTFVDRSEPIFTDDFESADTSRWNCD